MSRSVVSPMAWLAFFVVAAFYAYQYVFRAFPGVMMHDIMSDFHIGPVQFGDFCGIYYVAYTLFHIPVGMMIDKIGVKKVIPLGIVLVAIGYIPLVFSHVWWMVLLGRALGGIGSAASVLGAFKIIRDHFPENKFAFLVGVFVTMGLIAGMLTGRPLLVPMLSFGWKRILLYMAILGCILAACAFFCLAAVSRSVKTNIKQIDEGAKNNGGGGLDDFKLIVGNGVGVFVCILGGLMVGPLEGFADAWGIEFVRAIYSFSMQEASIVPTAIFLGMAIGSPLIGQLTARTRAYNTIPLVCATTMCLCFLTMMYGYGSIKFLLFGFEFDTIYVLLFVMGIACGYQVAVITRVTLSCPERVAGMAGAVSNMAIMVFGYVFHKCISYMVALGGKLDNGLYSVNTMTNAIAILPCALSIAMAGFLVLLIKPKIGRNSQKGSI